MVDFEIKWSDSVKFLKGEEKTIIANVDNAKSIFVSNECMDIIDNASKKGLHLQEVLNQIIDVGSKKYFQKLMERLDELEMFGVRDNQIALNELDISLDITNECNLRCKHCSVSAGDGMRGKDVSTEEMKKLIEKITNLAPRVISISGGEPLVREDFKELSSYLRKGFSGVLFLMTNATLIDDKMAKFISENYDYVDVSIDGIDENTCSKIRGEGVFEKTIRGIKLLNEYGCKVTASMVMTESNKKLKEAFCELCENELKIQHIYRSFEPVGRGELNKELLQINEEQEPVCWEICEKKFVENKLYEHMPQIFACQGAKREYQIGHTGNLYPCAAMMDEEFIMGNLFDIDNLGGYLLLGEYRNSEGYKNFEKYLPYNVLKCKDCNKQLLCFSCTNTVKRNVKDGTLENVCRENQKFFDLYWRYYGIS